VCSLAGTLPAQAAQLNSFNGSIVGEVKNITGVSQMGAAVILYNRYDRAIRQVLTDAKGNFAFDALTPDLYSIRVSLNSFVPAFKRNISVQPGLQSLLTINLAGMLSTVELVSTTPSTGSFMTPDWKWVLRSAQSTRPVLRFLDSSSTDKPRYSHVFSETRGIVKVSAGDASATGSTAQPDLGTAFALATSLFGSNQLQFSGNVGYASHSGMPTAGFSTTYSHAEGVGQGPEITVTMRQISLPSRNGFGLGYGDSGSALKTLGISMIDEFVVMENVRFEYGMSAETVSLLTQMNTLSPFARLTYDLGEGTTFQIAYSNGSPAAELAARTGVPVIRENAELQRDLAVLGSLPSVSVIDGRTRVQRTSNLEIGYTKVAGPRTYTAGVYREVVTNGVLTLAGSEDLYPGDVIPDLGSSSSMFNIGNFSRWGYMASLSQRLGDNFEVALGYGRGGALTSDGQQLMTEDADELRAMVKIKERNWATLRVAGTAPVTGTHFAASYGWADYHSLMPSHNFLTQRNRSEPGLNISIRQPIPSFGLIPGRFEATAELRNLLEQGYLPFSTSDGQT